MKTKLNRTLTLSNTILYGIGSMIGAGIFVLVGKIIGISGQWAPISFILAGTIALLSGLSYAEMVSRYPDAAGASKYVYKAFNNKTIGLIVGILVIASGLVSAGVLTNGFADYLQTIIPINHNFVVIAITLTLGIIACRGINLSSKFVAITAVLIIITILILAYLGTDGRMTFPQYMQGLPKQKIPFGQITTGAFLAYYVFVGFEDVVNNAEEIKQPEKNIPKAFIIMLLATIFLYTIVVLTLLFNNQSTGILEDPTPIASLYTQLTNLKPWPITIAILIAASSSILVQIIMASRLAFGMAKQKWIAKQLAYVHPKRKTPLTATIVMIIITLIGSLIGNITSLAKATSIFILCIFFLVHLGLVTFKIKEKAQNIPRKKHFSLPIRLPFL